jgi:hypothetical protein
MISQGSRKPSIVPLLMASGTAGTGMPTGLAPSAARSVLVWRGGARLFRPGKSARGFTCVSRVCTKPTIWERRAQHWTAS